jgi:TPR repeat protein
MALRLCAVAGVAAAVAWLVISLPGTRLLRHDTVHADIQVPPPVADAPKQDPLRTPAAAGLLLQHGLTEANAAQPPAEALPVAAPPPLSAPPSSDAAVTQIVSLPLDADEIAMLLKRGKDAFSTGDLAAARLLLRRAAEAGSAEAALALGATFDPLVIRRLGAIGAAPDAAQARQWYQKAVALGSTTASQPLAQLEASAQ